MTDDDAPPRTLTDAAVPASLPREAAPDKPAEDPYEVLGEQGRGGLGVVLRARDHRLGRTVAVKILVDAHDGATRRFEREAQLTARLQHPGIVPVHEAGRWANGMPFYAMKLVSGRTLKAVMAERTTLAERLALLSNIVDVADAIAYAHSEDVIHRDLKPSNVLVGAFGETVVVDWGLAKDLRSDDPLDAPVDDVYRTNAATGLTVSGSVMGTPSYMPPEQARGENVDKRADVYSLGAMLYQLLAGVPPYSGERADVIIAKVLAGPPPPIAEVARGAPPELIAIVERAMSRSPADRYPDGKALVSAHQYGRTSLLARWVRQHRLAVVATAMAVLAAGITGALSVGRIVREREAAEDARRVAEDRERQAEAARAEVETQRNQLLLAQARTSLASDPTTAISWLVRYPLAPHDWLTAQAIAADAESRGIASAVVPGTFPLAQLVLSPGGDLVACFRPEGLLQVIRLADGHVVFEEAASRSSEVFAATADGSRVAYVTRANQLSVLDLAAPVPLRLQLDGTEIDAATFSHDGAALILYGPMGGRRCAAASGECEPLSLPAMGRLRGMWLSRDGQWLLTWDTNETIRLLDLRSGREHLRRSGAELRSIIRFLPASSDVLVSNGSRAVGIFRVDDRMSRARATSVGDVTTTGANEAHDLVIGDSSGHVTFSGVQGAPEDFACTTSPVVSVAVAADASLIVAGSLDGTVCAFRRRAGAVWRLTGHVGPVNSIAITPDGGMIVTGGQDGAVRIWQVPAHDPQIVRATTPLLTAAWAASSAKVAFGAQDGTVFIYDLEARKVTQLRGHRALVSSVGFSPDEKKVISASWDHDLRVWDLETGRSLVLTGHQGAVNGVRLLHDGRQALSIGEDGRVFLWDLQDGHANELLAKQSPIRRMASTADGAHVVVAPSGSHVVLVSAPDYRPLDLGVKGERVTALAISADGRFVAVGREDGQLAVLAANGEARSRTVLDGRPDRLAFDHRGTRLAAGTGNGNVFVLDVQNSSVREVGHHGGSVRTVLFQSENLLLTGGEDGAMNTWRIDVGTVHVRREGTGDITFLALSPDNRWLATATWGGVGSVREAAELPTPFADLHSFQEWLGSLGIDRQTDGEPLPMRSHNE